MSPHAHSLYIIILIMQIYLAESCANYWHAVDPSSHTQSKMYI
jgi:hypothetical protein